ncbi:hypothetical protein [Paenibacillus sp. RC67]|uniref:hypothetical protein n=1 Tax=Paenibacillus sp. RC67 TaxID=3039392 RepID=UPI0024ACFA00|nr:hypothetical protein [Paenibacillus sp. RC67]
MEFMFAPPPYLYVLKILLIHLNESDLVACGIHKSNIQHFVREIFATQYDSIEANSRLYFAYEFPIVFAELIKSDNEYDLNEILADEKYLKVIMDSIARCDVFWDILVDIQERYYASSKEAFYRFPIVQSSIIERITSEVIWDVQEDILSKITSEIEDNYDELEEYEDVYEMTNFVLQGIVDDIHDQITEIMNAKLDKRGINSITAEDFDIDTILSEDIDIHDMIERKYYEMMYSQSDEYKQQLQEPIENIVELFEDTYWLS